MQKVWLILIPLLFGLNNAQPWGKILRSPWLIKEIGLTKDQRVKMEDILLESEKKIAEIEPQLRIKRMELAILMGESKPDENKAITLVNEIGKLRTQLSLIRVKRRIGLKKLLTLEQQEKLGKLLTKQRKRAKKRFKP